MIIKNSNDDFIIKIRLMVNKQFFNHFTMAKLILIDQVVMLTNQRVDDIIAVEGVM